MLRKEVFVNTVRTSEDTAERNLHDQIVRCLLDVGDRTVLMVRMSARVQKSSMT
jgi:hypothetical protein